MPRRLDAWGLLREHIKNPGLIKHCLSVEAAMRLYAEKFGRDIEEWGAAGLLHDLDYEEYPEPEPVQRTGHPFEAVKWLAEAGYSQEITDAVLSHATYSNKPRVSQMAKCLFASDELCGFVLALAYVRPERLAGMTAESVKKRLKNKKFAEKINRDEIAQGIAELGLPEYEHIANVIQAMQSIEDELFEK